MKSKKQKEYYRKIDEKLKASELNGQEKQESKDAKNTNNGNKNSKKLTTA